MFLHDTVALNAQVSETKQEVTQVPLTTRQFIPLIKQRPRVVEYVTAWIILKFTNYGG